MKVPIVTVVGLLVVTFVFWIGQAEAQHRGGKGNAAPAHPPKGGARPGVVKAHPPQPKTKAQQKSKGGVAKAPTQNKQNRRDSADAKHDEKKKHTAAEAHHDEKKKHAAAEAKHDEKKKHTAKEKEREHVKKAEKRAPATIAAGGPDHESISLLQAAHQKLEMVNHDYGVHRHRATEHVDSALRHLGSSAPASIGLGRGRMNSPQPLSDAMMREARASLEMIRSRLAARTTAAAGHGAAHGAVDAAIREIDLALAVR
jgi:hypothetical protein